jgi:hypothetical protein
MQRPEALQVPVWQTPPGQQAWPIAPHDAQCVLVSQASPVLHQNPGPASAGLFP